MKGQSFRASRERGGGDKLNSNNDLESKMVQRILSSNNFMKHQSFCASRVMGGGGGTASCPNMNF